MLGGQEPRDRAHRGRLAGAVEADQSDHLAFANAKRNALDGADGMAVDDFQAFDLEKRLAHRVPRCAAR
jgi:hypothetical protein